MHYRVIQPQPGVGRGFLNAAEPSRQSTETLLDCCDSPSPANSLCSIEAMLQSSRSNPDSPVTLQATPGGTADSTDVTGSWTDEKEVVAYQWQDLCVRRAQTHVDLAVAMQFLYQFMSFPIYTIPLVVAQLQKFDTGDLQTAIQYLMTANAVLAGLNTATNLGKRSEQHFNLEAQFSRLGKVLGVELEKRKDQRQPVDSFLVTMAYQIESLMALSPVMTCTRASATLVWCTRLGSRTLRRMWCCCRRR